MAAATQANAQTGSTLKGFEDKIHAQVGEAKTKLAQIEATAKEKRSQAETAAISRLQTVTQEIDRKLEDLKATHAAHVARAKSGIEADVAKFKASVEGLAAKFKTTKK